MLRHGPTTGEPGRVVVLGSRGFIGRRLVARLIAHGANILELPSSVLDLTQSEANVQLAGMLQREDCLVMLSALTPRFGRDVGTLRRNLDMGDAVCSALSKAPVAQVVYVSSDAVYAMQAGVISEETPAAPNDLYGLMHRTREVLFASAVDARSLAIVRPTMVVGPGDPHNSYGPNRFLREARVGRKVTLGGSGDDTRDYVYVEDVARLLTSIAVHRSSGLLNIASGRSTSAVEVVKAIEKIVGVPLEVCYQRRATPATHRSFNIEALVRAFPDFEPTPLLDALSLTQSLEPSDGPAR